MDVFLQPGNGFGDSVQGRVRSHIASLVAENSKGEDSFTGPEGGGGVIDFAVGVNTNSVNGGSDSANPVSETGAGFAFDLNFLLEGVDDLFRCLVDTFVHWHVLAAGTVSALSEKSLESGCADPEKLESEVGFGIEFRFELAGEVAEGDFELAPDILEIGELHGDRDGVDRICIAQLLLSTESDVGGAFGEWGDLVVTEIDISFRKKDEGVLALNKDVGRTLH